MNAIDKRRVSNIKERSRPARTHTRDLKVQVKNGRRNLKAKEVDAKPLADKSNTNTSLRDIDVSADASENMVADCMENQHASEEGLVDDAKTGKGVEQGNGGYSNDNSSSAVECAEESDAETTCDSVSSQGDSHNADERAENIARVPKKISGNQSSNDSSHAAGSMSNSKINNSKNKASKNTPKKGAESKKAISTLATKSSSDNIKNMKVHPKPLSDSSEGADSQPLELHERINVLDETSTDHHSVSTDDGVINFDENNGLEDQATIDQKISEMESRINNLESELREVAALEIALYSVVPEHGSSAHKVHTPARRLSRIYIYACKHWSQDKCATVAKNIVSGLVLVSKSCGNDVSRLTFWLSNTIVLREIISQTFGSSCQSSSLVKAYESNGNETKSSLKWKNGSGSGKMNKQGLLQFLDDWQETRTFTLALEKVESWIFLRIVESIWWQTLTPNMQSSLPDSATNKNTIKLMGPAFGDQGQGVFSIDLWENAFHDALKRLCPVRAGGHECGCLPVLARKVMEQCVGRLDVAMFNAILRESAHEIPTDPLSDPIVDSKVLPIPAGYLSFGSGAQLKNAIGNWARWLSDFLGMDADISANDDTKTFESSDVSDVKETKIFHLLNALSDLLMLPKDMLIDSAIRMEVCPSISLSLVKRILCNFSPDEFSPDPVPGTVLEALNAECIVERTLSGDDNTFPHTAAPVVYTLPSSSEVAEKVAEAGAAPQFSRSASVVRRKGYTSDEELDELESCLQSVVNLNENEGEGVGDDGGNARYDLLRQVWKAS